MAFSYPKPFRKFRPCSDLNAGVICHLPDSIPQLLQSSALHSSYVTIAFALLEPAKLFSCWRASLDTLVLLPGTPFLAAFGPGQPVLP